VRLWVAAHVEDILTALMVIVFVAAILVTAGQ
jgi:hypothetical protein